MNTVFARDTNCVTRCVAGETIIVPIRGQAANLESIFTLNEVGTTIWNLLDGRAPVEGIVERLCSEYDTNPEEAHRDTVEFLDALKGLGLVTETPRANIFGKSHG